MYSHNTHLLVCKSSRLSYHSRPLAAEDLCLFVCVPKVGGTKVLLGDLFGVGCASLEVRRGDVGEAGRVHARVSEREEVVLYHSSQSGRA